MISIDALLDFSIFFSFDRSGYERHQKHFDPRDQKMRLDGKVCLVTGANAGLGYETAIGLAKLGARVVLLCRNPEKGAEAARKIQEQTQNQFVSFAQLDVSDLSSVRNFVEQFSEPRVDVLIHNAGILPSARSVTKEGIEMTLATHGVGPFLLTYLLMPKLRASQDARVITVSSGGMYLQPLDLKNIQADQGSYSGVTAYANTKRAQVILNELWATNESYSGVKFNAMHPGWAATPGVKKSLPTFWGFLKSRLRTPAQGADTAIWLAASDSVKNISGKFWFDRKQVPTHLLPWTKESKQERKKLWDLLVDLSGLNIS